MGVAWEKVEHFWVLQGIKETPLQGSRSRIFQGSIEKKSGERWNTSSGFQGKREHFLGVPGEKGIISLRTLLRDSGGNSRNIYGHREFWNKKIT